MTTTKKAMIKGTQKPAPPAYKYFNLKAVIDDVGIQADKVYNNFKGLYNSLNDSDRKRIATVLMGPTSEVFARLGIEVKFSKMADGPKTNGRPGQS